MKLSSIRYKKYTRAVAQILAVAMVMLNTGPVWAGPNDICTADNLADVPLMLLASTGPPGLFMISLDNSETMGYEVMVVGETDAMFVAPGGTAYGQLFHGNDDPIEDSAADQNAWKSQWYGYNKLYYNPHVGAEDEYSPWPTKSDMNVNTPFWDPQAQGNGDATFDLTQTWATIEYTDPAAPPPDPTVFASANGATRTAPSGCTWLQGTYTPPEDPTAWIYYWYTSGSVPNTKGLSFTVTWTLTAADGINPAAQYDVFARYPDPCASNSVTYQIQDNATVLQSTTIDQDTHTDSRWFQLNPAASPVTFSTGTAKVVMDNPLTKNRAVGCSATNKPAYHAQLKFVPRPPVLTYDLTRRHFYLTSPDTGTDADSDPDIYLIDLNDADTAHFFRLIDSNGNDIGDAGEYQLLTYADLPADIKAVIPAPGAGAYTGQLQNFANWFSYYRKRISSAQNAIAVVVDEMSNMLVGMMTSPPSAQQGKTGALWIDCNFDGQSIDMTSDFFNVLYNLPAVHSNRGFSEDLTDMGDYYELRGGNIANQGDKAIIEDPYNNLPDEDHYTDGDYYPWFKPEYGGDCQQAFAMVLTDGAAPSTAAIKNYDGTSQYGDSIYDEGIFGDAFEKTAADAAMQYYERDLKPAGGRGPLDNHVPTNYIDHATHQHMVTYGVSFGMDGPLRQASPDFNALCADDSADPPTNACKCFGPTDSCPTWIEPVTPPEVMDDLWHATVNARGLFMHADDPQELIDQLRLVKADIERRMGAAAAVTTNAIQRQIGATIFQGVYNSEKWWGDLQAFSVDIETGSVAGFPDWSAKEQLDGEAAKSIPERSYTTRKIFTSDGADTASDFSAYSFASLTTDQKNYIRGQRTNEIQNGGTLRDRGSKLGDIVHSEPYVFGSVVYIGANDGMLHAFRMSDGWELFAYVPHIVHDNLWKITDPDFYDHHQFYVDATPHVYGFGTSATPTAYLAGGLGKGGKGVYCLNVTNATSSAVSASNIYNWEYADPSDADLGYVYGRAYVVKTTAGPTVIFGNGYASDSHKAVLYALSAVDGSTIAKLDTGDTGDNGCNGMSSPAVIDMTNDHIADYVYAGDLDGNLWKFDITDDDPLNWSISYGGHPLFTARDASGNVQPITSEPDAMMHCEDFRVGVIVVFGTGQYLNENDLGANVADQAIYGIYDWEKDLETAGSAYSGADDASNYYLGSPYNFGTDFANLHHLTDINFPAGSPAGLLAQSQVSDTTAQGDEYRQTTDNPINYYNPYLPTGTDQGSTHVGWYYTLPDASERMVRDPIIRAGVVIAVANTIESGTCTGGGGAWLYALDACSGGRPETPQFDVNGNGEFDEGDTVAGEYPSGKKFDTFLFDPVAMGGKLYLNDTFGNIIEEDIPPDPAKVFYWRVIE